MDGGMKTKPSEVPRPQKTNITYFLYVVSFQAFDICANFQRTTEVRQIVRDWEERGVS